MSHCGTSHAKIDKPEPGSVTLALVGNPNNGKSVFFNALTGMYVNVSNYPGTTVDVSRGRWRHFVVLDTPGVYGISSFNDEERVARDVILDADVVLNVVDATNLERSLFLTLQLIDMGIPMVVAVNMMDEAAARGIEIDTARLEELLGVPVIPTVAVKGQGIEKVKARIDRARPGRPDPALEADLRFRSAKGRERRELVLALEGDGEDERGAGGCCGPAADGSREERYLSRHKRAEAIARSVKRETRRREGRGALLSRLMMQPATGLPILGLILVGLYYLVGVLIAQIVVGFTEETVMSGYYEPAVRRLVGLALPQGSALYEVLAGEFGALTMTITYAVGLLLPLVTGFYLAISLMEDTGYFPRLAVLTDRALTAVGLNGRAIVPLILGLGCVTMATLTTRVLGSRRERLIATFLLALAVPCSAQLAVITTMLAPLGPTYMAYYVGIMLTIFLGVGVLLGRLLPGHSTCLLMDLPPLRWPQPANILKKTYTRTAHFLREATPLFFYGALAIGVLDVTGALGWLQESLRPLTVGWLGLPQEAARAFVMGIVRRDFGAAGLYDLSLSPLQRVGALVTITLFVPCIASMLMILKERGRVDALLIWTAAFAAAFAIGGVVVRVLPLLGIR